MKRMMVFLLVTIFFAAACSPVAALPVGTLGFETRVDPEAWAMVPAGEFLMGQFAHETQVDYDYEIMVTDVTNAQYAAYLNEAEPAGVVQTAGGQVTGYYPGDVFRGYEHEEEIAAGDYLHLPLNEQAGHLGYDGEKFAAAPGYEQHPVVMVTWFGAKAFCEYYGWRLPSEVEWEKAARGSDGRPYPWGDEIESQNANYYTSRDPFEDALPKLGETTPVGFYDGSTYAGYQTIDSPSPFGLYDMAGNVWQWTGDVYEDQHYRYLRGGSLTSYEPDLRVWVRNNAAPTYFSPSVGFRCARDGGD